MLNDGRMLGRAGCWSWGKATARLSNVSLVSQCTWTDDYAPAQADGSEKNRKLHSDMSRGYELI
jgi:hypothetical protein